MLQNWRTSKPLRSTSAKHHLKFYQQTHWYRVENTLTPYYSTEMRKPLHLGVGKSDKMVFNSIFDNGFKKVKKTKGFQTAKILSWKVKISSACCDTRWSKTAKIRLAWNRPCWWYSLFIQSSLIIRDHTLVWMAEKTLLAKNVKKGCFKNKHFQQKCYKFE